MDAAADGDAKQSTHQEAMEGKGKAAGLCTMPVGSGHQWGYRVGQTQPQYKRNGQDVVDQGRPCQEGGIDRTYHGTVDDAQDDLGHISQDNGYRNRDDATVQTTHNSVLH